jgi:hypothetical protein
MKSALAMLLTLSALSVFAAASARADACAWIKRCVSDNKDEGQTVPVVFA